MAATGPYKTVTCWISEARLGCIYPGTGMGLTSDSSHMCHTQGIPFQKMR